MALSHPLLDGLEVFDPGVMSLRFNRRLTMRYVCGPAMTARVKLDKTDLFRHARGHNISKGGMAIILDECPEVGLVVNLHLHNHVLNIGYELTARIVHVAATKDREWVVGLAFARQLSQVELLSLL